MSGPVILGVDPGKTGALAWHSGAGGLVVHDMPDLTGAALAACLADLILEDGRPAEAWVEKVGAMPKQGVASTWKFAEGYGVILGVLGVLQVPVRLVTPAAWKKAAGLGKDKNASRQRAVELWPHCSHLFARVKDDGRAEAALIARHGWTNRAASAAGEGE